MARRRGRTPVQIVRKLYEADRLLAEHQAVPEVAEAPEICEQTHQRWRSSTAG